MNRWILFAFILPMLLVLESCNTSRSYSRDYTVNRSARTKARSHSSARTTKRVKPRGQSIRPATRERTYARSEPASKTNRSRSSSIREELTERNRIVDFAAQFEGKPYDYGGKTPESGFDCSGLMYYTYRHFDYRINASSRAQAQQGRKVSIKDTAPGDLLFFGHRGQVNHVAMVTSNTGRQLHIIHSTSSGGVITEDYYRSDYWKRRFLFAKTYIGVLDGGSMANR